MENPIDKLERWLSREIRRCEHEIDRGGAFYILSSEKETYERVLEKIRDFMVE